jgi:hypothetical protein
VVFLKIQQSCSEYYFLYLPMCVLIAAAILVWSDGTRALLFLLPIVLVILGGTTYAMQKAVEELQTQSRHFKLVYDDLDHFQRTSKNYLNELNINAENSVFWYKQYMDLRLDRAAMLKALCQFSPAGYRIESYLFEAPLDHFERNHNSLENQNTPGYFLPNTIPIQTFLYLDYGKEHGDQLRLRVSSEVIRIIGDLPDYDKVRVNLIEAESREKWRHWLTDLKLQPVASTTES